MCHFVQESAESSVKFDSSYDLNFTRFSPRSHLSRRRACQSSFTFCTVRPRGSESRVGDVTVYVPDINQPSSPTPFYSVLVPVSVFMALSIVFHSINSPDNSPLSHSVLLVLFLPYWSFQIHDLFIRVSLSPDVILCG